MKKALAILIFTSLFTQCIVQLGVYTYYRINRDYIAQNLCENRHNPKMKCCGKCYLRKQLNKVDDTTPSKNLPKIDKDEMVYIPTSFLQFNSCSVTHLIIQNPARTSLYGVQYLTGIFHPPAATC